MKTPGSSAYRDASPWIPLLKRTVIALVLLVILDTAWLVLGFTGPYRGEIAHLLSEQPRWLAALLAYLVGATGIAVLTPRDDGREHAALRGAVLGLAAYGTYALTNLAVFAEWPVLLAVTDMAWGAVLFAMTAAVVAGDQR